MEQVFELAVKKWDDQCTAPPQHALGFLYVLATIVASE